MAGVVPKRSASGRKQWTLHDGHKTLRLRHQMATDGCSESQVVLAKQLLDEQCELEAETKENEQMGVYWLIKASQQGNIEATDLLKTCLQSGKGITELNYLDVKSCITMTQDEKVARKAAREMFACLSNGGDYITSNLLQKRMLAIEKGPPPETNGKLYETESAFANGELVYDEIESDESEDTDWSLKSDEYNEKLTEDHLVSAAVDYSHGLLPIVNRSMCLTEPHLRALDNIPLVHRSILHPILALKILYFKMIHFLSKQFRLFLPLAKSEIQFFLMILIYTLISFENILYLVPLLVYYSSFVLMVISTCQMLQIKREFHDFRLWSGLFICYSGGDLNSDQAEYQYILNNMKPYGLFFGALLVNLLTYPVIAEQWIPQSELMIVSFCLTFMTLLGFMQKRRGKTIFDLAVLFSFGVNVLAKYPYEIDPVVAQGWRFLDLKIPTFASYVIGNGIEFCINFRLALYLCIPLILTKLASTQNWRGTYKTLIPHCVTLSWLQVFIISAQGATMFGLLRGSLALVGFVLFLPLFGLTSVLLPSIAITKWVINSNFLFSMGCITLLTCIGLALCYTFAQTRYRKVMALIQIYSTIVAIVLLLKHLDLSLIQSGGGVSTSGGDDKYYYEKSELPEFLTWEVYQRFCHQPVWQEENVAIAQMKCNQLHNSHVNWDGYINEIKIKSIENHYKKLFDKFPNHFREQLYCFYGDVHQDDCENFPKAVRDECFSFYNSIKSVNVCSLEKFNIYTFEITVRMSSGIWGKNPEISLVAENVFRNFTLRLKPNDHIWFKGMLFNNEVIGSDGILGGLKTHVNLDEVGCLACADSKLSNYKRIIDSNVYVKNVVKCFVVGIKFVLNALLNPILVFK